MYSLLFLILLTGVAAQNLPERPSNFTGSREAALVCLTGEDITLVNAKILVMLDLVPPIDIETAVTSSTIIKCCSN